MSSRTLNPQRRFASLKTACEHIDVTERTLRNYIARGELTGYRLGSRTIRIDLDELEALLKPIPTAGGAA